MQIHNQLQKDGKDQEKKIQYDWFLQLITGSEGGGVEDRMRREADVTQQAPYAV